MIAVSAFTVVWIALAVVLGLPFLLILTALVSIAIAQRRYKAGKGNNPFG